VAVGRQDQSRRRESLQDGEGGRAAQDDDLRERVGDSADRGYDRHAAGANAGRAVTRMDNRTDPPAADKPPTEVVGGRRDRSLTETRQWDQEAGPARMADVHGLGAGTEDTEVAPRIHDATRNTGHAQRLHCQVHRVSLGDAAQIDEKGPSVAYAPAWPELDIGDRSLTFGHGVVERWQVPPLHELWRDRRVEEAFARLGNLSREGKHGEGLRCHADRPVPCLAIQPAQLALGVMEAHEIVNAAHRAECGVHTAMQHGARRPTDDHLDDGPEQRAGTTKIT